MSRILLPAARGEAISRRFGHGLRTWSIKASGRTKRMFSPSRSRDCPGRRTSISLAKSTRRPDQRGRRWFVAHGTLRCRPYHTDQAAQGLLITEELGDADRQACRREQGQGGARPPTGGDHTSHACRTSPLQRCNNLTGGAQQFGQVTTPGLLKPKCLRQDDGSR